MSKLKDVSELGKRKKKSKPVVLKKQKTIISDLEKNSDKDMAFNDNHDKITEDDEQMEDEAWSNEKDMSKDNNFRISTIKSKKVKQKFINNIENNENSEGMESSDEERSVSNEETEQDENENNVSDDDELLPIEKANKRLRRKIQEEE